MNEHFWYPINIISQNPYPMPQASYANISFLVSPYESA